MKLGAAIQPTTANPQFGELTRFAQHLEATGFESLWTTQATGRGFMLPDPLLVLAAAAAATSKPTLGTAVLQLSLYAPGHLAHLLLSLRHLAGDRLRIGVGAGSTAADFSVFDQDYAGRFKRFDTNLSAVKTLLAGETYNDTNLTPYASIQGCPPIYLGTWSKGIMRAATDFDGWIGSAANRTVEQLIELLKVYRAGGGRHATVSTIALGKESKPGEHRARIEAFAEAGFDEAVVMFRPGGPTPEEVRGWL